MKSTDRGPRPPPSFASVAEGPDRFEMLRAAYHARLAEDRERIGRLNRRFERTVPRSAELYAEIRTVAHAMAGAAAVFERFDLAAAAGELEDSARAAAAAPDASTEADVHSGLAALERLLGNLNR